MTRPGYAPAAELLLATLRVGPKGSLEPPVPHGISWPIFVELTDRHGVAGLVVRALAEAGIRPPADAARALRAQHEQAIFQGLRVERARAQVVAVLQEAGVRDVALLKGAWLLPLLYGGPGARRVLDLDLLVRAADQERVHDALLTAGYGHIPKPPGRPAAQRAAYERTYVREGEVLVDVHVAFTEPSRLRMSMDPVFARSTLLPDGARALDDVDTLLSLAVHLGQDCFAGPLKGLVDVARFLDARRPDLREAARRARQAEAATVLWLGLRLAHERLGAPVDADVVASLAPGPLRRAWLTGLYAGRGEAPYPFLHAKRSAQALALYPLMDSSRARARFTSRFLYLRAIDAAFGRSLPRRFR